MTVNRVDVHHTHISVVFLAGPIAYKIRKPVALDFLDFTTLEERRRDCEDEIRLNHRLAPDVYLGIVPITVSGSAVRVEGDGEIVEWAVKMKRLPDEANLRHRLLSGNVGVELIEALAAKIARFHSLADRGPRIAAYGSFKTVAGNCRENFEQSAAQIPAAVSRTVFERLRNLTIDELSRFRSLIESRAARGVPCDTHGDLRLDHVYVFPERTSEANLEIIDCIEFNERFRFADPVADMAFLVMDLQLHGRPDLARAFTDSYVRASGDEEARSLLPLYTSYRAAVRGKVEGLKLAQKEIAGVERTRALAKARCAWLVALGALEEPNKRPCLVLIGGLPGAGKSTLAESLAASAGFEVIRSDAVRKQLSGILDQDATSRDFGEGIYSEAWTDRTYAECLHRAELLLTEGRRVVIDASFRAETRRRTFLEAATRCGVPGVFLHCHCAPDVARERLAARRQDVSDADWAIYQRAAAVWQEAGSLTRLRARVVDTTSGRAAALASALAALDGIGLYR